MAQPAGTQAADHEYQHFAQIRRRTASVVIASFMCPRCGANPGVSCSFGDGRQRKMPCAARTERAIASGMGLEVRRVYVPSPIIHGRLHAYFNRGCRCSECKRVGSLYRKKSAA